MINQTTKILDRPLFEGKERQKVVFLTGSGAETPVSEADGGRNRVGTVGITAYADGRRDFIQEPPRRKVRVTSRSRVMFRENFRRQNAALPFGFVPCFGQPCQKQPSTKIASLSFGKMKSGLPKIFRLRRQPVILFRRNNFASAT